MKLLTPLVGFQDKGGQLYNVMAYGATGNLLTFSDGVATASSTTFTSSSATFTSADVGKYIELPGAGVSGATLATTIATYVSAHSVTLTAAATTAATGISYWYGTDDTAALQTAVTACINAGGGTIYAPPGKYLVSSRIHFLGSNWIMAGAGQGATYFRETANDNQEIFIAGNGNSNDVGAGDSGTVIPTNFGWFQDLTVDGNKANQTPQASWTGYSTSATRNLIRFRSDAQSSYGGGCRRVTAINGIQNGLSCESQAQGSFTECTAENMDQNGIWVENGSDWVVQNCYTRGNGQNTTIGGYGIQFNSFGGFVCANNSCKGDFGGGIGIQSSGQGTVANNSIYRPGWQASGTYNPANGIVVSVGANVSITGNTIYGAYGHGIYLDDNAWTSVTGNTFRRNGQYANATYSDIYLTYLGASPNSHCSFIGNTFENDTATYYTNAVAYNIGVYQSATGHTNNVFAYNTFGAPVTGYVDPGLLAGNNTWGAHDDLDPQAVYNYGYFSSSTQTISPAAGNYLIGTGYNSPIAVTISNGIYNGQQFTLEYRQGTGNKQLTWAANVRFSGGVAPTFSGVASTSDFLTFVWDATDSIWAGTYSQTAATTSSPGDIQLSGDLGGTGTSPTVISTHLASALPIAQGGTGSATQNFVDLTTAQTIAGVKTFSAGIARRVNTVTATSNTYTPNCATTDIAIISSPTANFTLANPTGTPVDGQDLVIRIASGSTSYTPTFGSVYTASNSTALPTTLTANVTTTLAFRYDAAKAMFVLFALDPAPVATVSAITRSVSNISSATTGGATALTDYVYICSATLTLTLPTAVSNTNRYTVLNTSTSSTITVATTSSQTINGSTTVAITAGQSLDLISNNANWFVI